MVDMSIGFVTGFGIVLLSGWLILQARVQLSRKSLQLLSRLDLQHLSSRF